MTAEPKEGDVYYVRLSEAYHVCKLLKIEAHERAWNVPFVVHHVLGYEPLTRPPSLPDLATWKVRYWHAPVAPDNELPPSERRIWLTNIPVTDTELQGYRAYLEIMQQQAVEEALEAYQLADKMCHEGRFQEAVALYSKAIARVPDFFEALDNRGLVYLDMKRIAEAEADFRRSIEVHDSDDNPLPHVKIIYCHLANGNQEAVTLKIRECLKRWPDHPELVGPEKRKKPFWKFW